MTYEEKADVFRRALEQSGDLAEALRVADQHASLRKVTPEQIEAMRSMRAAGARIKTVAEKFGISENSASRHCRGVVPAPAPPRPPSPLGLDVAARAGHAFGLPSGWHDVPRRGRRSTAVASAYRVATIAMRALGLTLAEIATVLGRHHSTVLYSLAQADGDQKARVRAAAIVAAIEAGARPPQRLVPPAVGDRQAAA